MSEKAAAPQSEDSAPERAEGAKALPTSKSSVTAGVAWAEGECIELFAGVMRSGGRDDASQVDKCASTLQAAIMTGDKADANSITCTLNSTATDDEVVRNAMVAVATNTAAHVCGEGLANATFEIEAKVCSSKQANILIILCKSSLCCCCVAV